MSQKFAVHKGLLCEEILEVYFGKSVAVVGKCIHHCGLLTLKSIIELTKLSFKKVRKCLLILIQHNLVQFTSYEEIVSEMEKKREKRLTTKLTSSGKKSKKKKKLPELLEKLSLDEKGIYYSLIEKNVIFLLSFGKFCSIVQNQIGEEECTFVFEKILLSGRLSFTKLDKKIHRDSNLEPGERSKDIKKALRNLLKHKFIKRIKQIGAAENSLVSDEKKRKKRKKNKEEKVYRVNYNKFLHVLRIEAIFNFVKELFKHKEGCVKIMDKILHKLVLPQIDKIKEKYSGDYDYETIRKLCKKDVPSEEEFAQNLILLLNRRILAPESIQGDLGKEEGDLEEENYFFNENEDLTEKLFYVPLRKIIERIKETDINTLMNSKFQVVGSRIYGLLSKGQKLESKSVAARILVSQRECNAFLIKMYQTGYVNLIDVPKTKDHNPARTIHLWCIDRQEIRQKIINNMYKTIRNLRIRHQEEQKEVMSKVVFGEDEEPSKEDMKLLNSLYKIEDRLEGYSIRVLEMLYIFEHY